ncbi:MAG: ribonucleoside-diphosphate reductase subunit alpha [Opitutaceae bacterium]
MSNTPLAHDLALKRTVHAPTEQKPIYAWRDVITNVEINLPPIVLLCPHGEERFDMAEVADTLGKALTNVFISQGEKDIFTDKNRAWVAQICRELGGNLTEMARKQNPLRLTLNALYELIEKTLVDNNAYMVAKSLLLNRSRKLSVSRESAAQSSVRVIRRNGHVVPWNDHKVEIAVRKTFLSLARDSAPAVAISKSVSDRVNASNQAFVRIEEVQDIVQEELMKAGHYKVAEAYILFRAERAVAREAAASGAAVEAPGGQTANQETLVVVKKPGGETVLWEGADLRKRIEYAMTGLDLCLSSDEIEQELRRSVYDQISQKDLDSTIILNSKTLIERDADFAKFAGRIQLTYIYEEVLGWDILRDGIGKLKECHQKAFRKYIEHGISIKRLNPRLLEFDLARLAGALDPSSDLEFDFLGVQTLYDRYLIVDKVSKSSRRIETPQFFWMRVAMGLFLDEKGDRESKAIGLYDLYKTRRFCSSTPTLFNSGTLHSQLSSCYLYVVDDSIEGIFQRGIAENAYLSKWAGGLGGSWTAVRGTGAYIGGTNGESQGVIPFLKLHNDQLVAVNQCFAPETVVYSADGPKAISEIKKGDLVLGNSGTYREVTEKFTYNQEGPMVAVKIKHSVTPIRVTSGHPFYAIRGVPMEQACDRTMGWLAKGKVQSRWIEAGDLKVGDYVAQTIPTQIIPVEGLTEEDARMYGILLGDGHLSKEGRQWGVSGNPTKDEHIQFVRQYLSERGIHTWETGRGETYVQVHWASGQGVLRDGTTGRITGAGEATMPFGYDDIYDKNGNKRIARRFSHLQHGHTRALVQGLLETDGGVSRGVEIYFTHTSRPLAEGIRYQLLRLGIPTAGQFQRRDNSHEGRRSDGTAIKFVGQTECFDVRIPAVMEIASLVGCKPLTKRNWITHDGCVYSRVRSVSSIPPLPFVFDLKVEGDETYMTNAALVHNGGKRKGSGCAYLESWHNDIFEFLELRKNTGDDRRRTHDMNTANWIPDLFMKRMEAREKWTLFRSNETPDLHDAYGRKFEELYLNYERLSDEGKVHGQKVEALDLWKKMLSMIFETGHPWITFKDPCNVRSPQDHVGTVHSSNLCTEICLNTSKEETAVCNLGSVILESHLLPDGSLDHRKLRETIRMAVRALDNVIDINFYPTEAAQRSNMRHRPIGLGVMGLANTLYMKGVAFASPEAVEFNDEAMEAIAYYAFEASSDLAAERGTYSSYKGSKWDRGLLPPDTVDLLERERGLPIQVPRTSRMNWEPLRAKIAAQGMRNSNVLAIAPTATISNITNTSPCIEPTYKNLFVKSNLSGEFIVLNPFLVKDLKARGLWDRDMMDNLKYFDGELKDIERIPADLKQKYLTAFDIDPKWVVDAAARRQKWIDQSQSVNLWIKTPDLKTLSHMYRHAWHAGLKTTYYLRGLGASNIEKATVQVKKEMRGAAGETKAETATRDAAAALSQAPFPEAGATPKQYSAEEKIACSIEAMRNGGTCEACQ